MDAAVGEAGKTRWLILIYHLPRDPSRHRVAVWRKLKALGVIYLQDGVVVLPEDTRLQVTGEFQEAGQCDWWPVTVVDTGQAGFVIEQYLEPAPA